MVSFAQLRALATDLDALRTWTLVANEGIIATAGILSGFAGAGASNRTLLIAATTASIAGLLSAGGAQWAEAAAERDAQLFAAEEEAEQLVDDPATALAELVAYYEEKGLEPELAHAVAEQLMAHDPLDAQLESEYGVLEIVSRAEVIAAGVGAAVGFGIGAAIPLLITVFAPVSVESWAIVVAVLISLTLTSLIGARAAHLNLRSTLARTLLVGVGTMAVSYVVGLLVV